MYQQLCTVLLIFLRIIIRTSSRVRNCIYTRTYIISKNYDSPFLWIAKQLAVVGRPYLTKLPVQVPVKSIWITGYKVFGSI